MLGKRNKGRELRRDVENRLREQKEIELTALHPRDRARLERAGGRVRKVGRRIQDSIDKRAPEGERIVRNKIKGGLHKLAGNDIIKRRRKK